MACFLINKMTNIMRMNIMKKFEEVHRGLKFTFESPDRGSLQFLVINNTFGERQTFWIYKTKGEKGRLPYDSGHWKFEKRSVTSGCVWQAIRKSCFHGVSDGLQIQISLLQAGGYPKPLMVAIAEKCINTLTAKGKNKEKNVDKKVVVLPYIHNFPSRMKKIPEKHKLRVV